MHITLGYTDHALQRMDERGLSKPIVEAVVRFPKQATLQGFDLLGRPYIGYQFDDFHVVTRAKTLQNGSIEHSVITAYVDLQHRLGRRQSRRRKLFACAADRKTMYRKWNHA